MSDERRQARPLAHPLSRHRLEAIYEDVPLPQHLAELIHRRTGCCANQPGAIMLWINTSESSARLDFQLPVELAQPFEAGPHGTKRIIV